MKKILIPACLIFMSLCSHAQSSDGKQLYESGKNFMKQGDFPNAIIVLSRALQYDQQNIAIIKDLALSYYFEKNNPKALEVIKTALDRDDVDDQTFQIAGNIYKELNMPDDCKKLYKKGLKKFPNSGPLYNELGELLESEKDFTSIKQWEKGIEHDPSYSKNYYNAAKFYFLTLDKVWSIIYGEIFINMEPTGTKTPEMKELLVESYKKLFADADIEQSNKDKNSFVKAFLQSMNKQTALASQGLNPEALSMIRTRFILDWTNGNNIKFPYQLFSYQQQLLQEGMFDAYNQWLFGPAQNVAKFQTWITAHSTEYSTFNNFQKGRIFKMRDGQYYH